MPARYTGPPYGDTPLDRIRRAGDHLVKIDVIGESSQSAANLRVGAYLQRGAEMNLADPNAMLLEAPDDVVREGRLELNCFRMRTSRGRLERALPPQDQVKTA